MGVAQAGCQDDRDARPGPRWARRLGPHFGPLVHGLSAFGSAELATRVVRLALTVVIARRLAPAIIGDAALALTICEFIKVLERTGTGPRIVSAPADELAITCNTAQHIYGWWTAALTVVQLALAAMLATWFHRPVAGGLLAALAAVYPLMALGHVPWFLMQRAGMNGRLARITAAQNIADQCLTALLLLAWPSPWAIALPKVLTAPLWLVLVRRAMVWRREPAAGRMPAAKLLRFSGGILAGEIMGTLRTQGDNLIVAAMLGTQALGLYYFAFNAGLGIMSSAVGAFGTVAFPVLCRAPAGRERAHALGRVMLLALLLLPAVALQSLAARWYVPLVFGARWQMAAPLVAILCLAAVPMLAMAVASAWLRALGRAGVDATGGMIVCICALGGLWLGARGGDVTMAARGLVIGQALAAAAFALWLWRGDGLAARPVLAVEA